LAEKLLDDKARSTVLAALTARSKEKAVDGRLFYPPESSVRIIYGGTPDGDLARKTLVDMYTQFGAENFIAEPVESLPKDFLYDLLRSLLRDRCLPQDLESTQKELAITRTKGDSKINEASRKDNTIASLRTLKSTAEEKLEEVTRELRTNKALHSNADMAKETAERRLRTSKMEVADLTNKVARFKPYAPRHLDF
jgi:hypothetical protein